MFFKELPESSQRFISKFFLDRKVYTIHPNGKPYSDEDEEEAQEIFGEEWDTMSPESKRIAAFAQHQIARGRKWNVTNIEFVRYDENLYNALVNMNAVSEENGQKKRVSLDATELGRFQV